MNYELLIEDVKNASKEDLKKIFFKVCEESNRRFKKIDDDFLERMDQLVRDYRAENLVLQEEADRRIKKINEDYEKRLDAALADREKENLILLKDQQFFTNLIINALKEYDV